MLSDNFCVDSHCRGKEVSLENSFPWQEKYFENQILQKITNVHYDPKITLKYPW